MAYDLISKKQTPANFARGGSDVSETSGVGASMMEDDTESRRVTFNQGLIGLAGLGGVLAGIFTKKKNDRVPLLMMGAPSVAGSAASFFVPKQHKQKVLLGGAAASVVAGLFYVARH